MSRETGQHSSEIDTNTTAELPGIFDVVLHDEMTNKLSKLHIE